MLDRWRERHGACYDNDGILMGLPDIRHNERSLRNLVRDRRVLGGRCLGHDHRRDRTSEYGAAIDHGNCEVGTDPDRRDRNMVGQHTVDLHISVGGLQHLWVWLHKHLRSDEQHPDAR